MRILPFIRPIKVGFPGFIAMPWTKTSPISSTTSLRTSPAPAEVPPDVIIISESIKLSIDFLSD